MACLPRVCVRRFVLAACTTMMMMMVVCVGGARGSSGGIDTMDGGGLSVLIMAYRRVASVDRMLGQLLEQQDRLQTQLSVVLAQSAETEMSSYAVEMRAMWQKYRARFHSARYVFTRHLTGDRSFSTNATKYGSKRNALLNLVHGLDEQFLTGIDDSPASSSAGVRRPGEDAPPTPLPIYTVVPSFTVVLEDDAIISPDLLSFFTFARDTATRRRIHRIEFATALSEQRPSLLVGMRDVSFADALQWWWAPGNDTAAAAVDALVATSRTVFTTRAWSLSRRAYRHRLRPLLHAMSTFEPPPAPPPPPPPPPPSRTPPPLTRPGAVIVGSPVLGDDSDAAAPPSSVVSPRTAVSPASWRAATPELSACLWCNEYCYDHAIEWVLQGVRFLTPRIPRVSQGGEGGMSSSAPATNAIYEGPPVSPARFHVDSLRGLVLRVFPGLGVSAIAPHRHGVWGDDPTAIPAAVGASDVLTVLLNEPVCQLAVAGAAMGLLLLYTICSGGCGGPCSMRRARRILLTSPSRVSRVAGWQSRQKET